MNVFEHVSAADSAAQYAAWVKPARSPETWVFGTVWSVLYVIIAIVMICLIVQITKKKLPRTLLIPFGLNIIFNLAFTPIQFRLLNLQLAFADIVLVLITLVRSMIAIWKYRKRMTLVYIPYLIWVSIATVLQYQILILNT